MWWVHSSQSRKLSEWSGTESGGEYNKIQLTGG